MTIFKTAREFQIKLASAVQDMKNNLFTAFSNASTALRKLEQYDPGYNEIYQLTGTLQHLNKQVQSNDPEFKYKLENQLSDIKKLSLMALEKNKFVGINGNLQQVVKAVHQLIPVDLTVVKNDEELPIS